MGRKLKELISADLVADAIRRAESERGGLTASGGDLVIQIAVPISELESIAWLKAQNLYPKIYWRNRDGSTEVAAVGNALAQTFSTYGDFSQCIDEARQRVQVASGDSNLMIVFGAFDSHSKADATWSGFPQSSIVAPKLSIVRENQRWTLMISIATADAGNAVEYVSRLLESSELPKSSSAQCSENLEFTDRSDFPGEQRWSEIAGQAIQSISNHEFEKVVLARRSDLTLNDAYDPMDLVSQLSTLNPSCYRIMYAPNADCAYLSLSPEPLFTCRNSKLKTEAIAGTISRGESRDDDSSLENQLKSSDKDRAEHRFVIDGITQSLEPLCDSIEVSDATSIVKLSKIQHLLAKIEASLKQSTTIGDVYGALHPTAAVCGTPRDDARRLISQLEGFQRGWYAGAHGIIIGDFAEFAVGIRSGVLRNRLLSIFTGAGIVRRSEPSAEWQELDEKLRSMIHTVVEVRV